MQVKVFEATDMNSGLKKVKEALGPDALILSTRTLRNGKLGLLGKPILEITAAVDSTWEEQKKPEAAPSQSAKIGNYNQEDKLNYQELWQQPQGEEPPRFAEAGSTEKESRPYQPHSTQALSGEINELRSIINGLTRRLGNMDTERVTQPYIEPEYQRKSSAIPADPIVQLLRSRGINHQVAELVSRFTRDSSETGTTEPQEKKNLNIVLGEILSKLFTLSAPLDNRPSKQKRISLIGPTGVGKTTTIAKLAANYINKFHGKVALITIDTYRIAAVEQLKVYGEIMNLPVEVVIKPHDLALALDRHKDCELILIDTAGRSPGNTMELEEMATFLDQKYAIENHLLLSATSRETEMEMVINRFSCLPISSIIFSKIDECSLLGILLNIHYKYNMPISYLTNGQRVPEDIITPTPTMIADLIMNNPGNLSNG